MNAPMWRVQEDVIAHPNVLQLAKERIPVPGDGEVAALARKGRVLDVSRAAAKGLRIGARQDH